MEYSFDYAAAYREIEHVDCIQSCQELKEYLRLCITDKKFHSYQYTGEVDYIKKLMVVISDWFECKQYYQESDVYTAWFTAWFIIVNRLYDGAYTYNDVITILQEYATSCPCDYDIMVEGSANVNVDKYKEVITHIITTSTTTEELHQRVAVIFNRRAQMQNNMANKITKLANIWTSYIKISEYVLPDEYFKIDMLHTIHMELNKDEC